MDRGGHIHYNVKMKNISIKQAGAADIPTLEGILTDTVRWLAELGLLLWHAEDVLWPKLSESYRLDDFYIACLDGVPAGCMSLSDYDPLFWPDIRKGEALFIHKLAVTGSARKAGVPDALIDFAKKECVRRHVPSLRVDCDALRPKLRALYERNGFVYVETKKMDLRTVFEVAMYVYFP